MAEKEQELGFETLACYQHASKLYSAAYRLASHLPDCERFNLADQLRRAALSTLLNIAEGYGRYHYLDKLRYFFIARGSLCEMLSAFIAAHQVGYMDDEQLDCVRTVEAEAEKTLNGYIGFIRKRQQGKQEYGGKYINDAISLYHIADHPTQFLEPVPDHQSLVTDHFNED